MLPEVIRKNYAACSGHELIDFAPTRFAYRPTGMHNNASALRRSTIIGRTRPQTGW